MLVLSLIAGCGGGGSDDVQYGYVRLVNATRADNLVLSADGDYDYTISSTSGNASSYAEVRTGSYSTAVNASDGSLTASANTTRSVGDDVYYTVVAYQRGGVIKEVTIEDSQSDPSSGYAKLTAKNAATDVGTLDIYLVPPGSSLTDRSPIFSALGNNSTTLTQSQTAGAYDLVVTAYNTPSDVRLTISSVTLSSQDIVTLILTPTTGGTLLDGVLVKQKGSVQLSQNTKSRVRIIAGFENTGTIHTVQATVGADALSQVSSPSIGTYALVTGGTSNYSVNVDGGPVAVLPDQTFSAGGDYTLVAYDSSAPAVTVLTDNNQIPSSGAKIRLVNTAIPSGISLSVNYSPIFSQVNYGVGSDYSGISTGTTILSLSSPAWSGYNDKQVSIASGGVYSYFILGTSANLYLLFNRDR